MDGPARDKTATRDSECAGELRHRDL